MGINREAIARHNHATREALLESILALLDRGDDEELSYQAIATAARVSERTVFRYFPNHAALREALVPRISQRLGSVEPPDAPDRIPAYVEALYRVSEANGGLVHTLVTTSLGRSILQGERTRRFDKIVQLLAATAPEHSPDEVRRAAAIIRHQASGATWDFYRHQARLSLDDAIAAACLTVTAALDGLGLTTSRRRQRRTS